MLKETFAERLEAVMKQKSLNTIEIAKLAGVSRQAVSYILNNNLKESKLALKFALALGVSYEWLAEGIEDKTFLEIKELIVFSNIFELLKFISTKQTEIKIKSVSYNKLINNDSFVFHPKDTAFYYYCSSNKSIKSSKYLLLDIEKITFSIVTENISNFSFPIIEIKEVLL